MKNYFIIFLIFLVLFIVSGCKLQNTKTAVIHIEVVSKKALGEEGNVFITGNKESLGNWNPNAVSLSKNEMGNFLGDFTFNIGDTIEFKFTQGNWANEAVGEKGEKLQNHTIIISKDTSYQIVVKNWKDKVDAAFGQITGQVEYYRNRTFPGLRSRDVVVWLPPDYEKNDKQRYAVLYAHDGQNVFDPSTSYTGFDWRIDEVTDSLIKENTIEPIIVVGVYNTPDRYFDYSNNEKGRLYIKFLAEDLKPFIDSVYRTNPEPQSTAVMGSSMGGLISFMLAWERPDVFGKAACLSPAFIIKRDDLDLDYVKEMKKFNAPKQLFVYIDNGTIGLEKELQPGIDMMMKDLDSRKLSYTWFPDEGAEHNEKAWAKRISKPLNFLFGKKQKSGSKSERNTSAYSY